MRKTILFIAALVSLVSAAGCRRVVILSFDAPNLPPLDRLFVEGVNPQKDQRELSGLGQTIGYYDVSATVIRVRVTACVGTEMVSDHTGNYDIHDDEVTIPIDRNIDPSPGTLTTASCRGGLGRLDGGSNDTGAGGELGGMGGSGLGGAGGDTTGGMGGEAGAGGAGGSGAAGIDGGASDTGDCGTDTHAPICDPPSGDAGAIPDPPPISAECVQYCSNVQNTCGSVYDSIDSCQRYCALAGWAGTATRDNTLTCRNMYLVGPALVTCSNAGPSGGNSGCGYPCPNFCAAWISICHVDPSEASACLTACTMNSLATAGADPECRFQLLQRALYDTRYCDYVKYGSSCLSCD
jgi:hypothetical protein